MPVPSRAERSSAASRCGEALAALVLLVGALVTSQGGAQEAVEPIHVEYTRIGPCPGDAAFLAGLLSRTAKFRIARPDEAALTLRVIVEAHERGARGRLAIVEVGSSVVTSLRSVEAKTCGDVVSALALASALAIDPGALAAPDASPGASDALPDGASAVEASPPAPDLPPASVARPGAGEGRSAAAMELRFSLGGGAEGASTLGIRPGLGVFVTLAMVRPGWFSPELRLRLSRSFAGDAQSTGVRGGTLVFSALALEPCPARIALWRALGFVPCLRFAGGSVEAQGPTRSPVQPWFELGALGRLVLDSGSFFSVEAHGGLRVPLVRDRFEVEPATIGGPRSLVYQAPAVVGAFGGDLVFHFP